MRRHEKASSAGSNEGNGNSRGLLRRAFATRGASSDSKGSGAPSRRLAPLGLLGTLILAISVVFGVASASAEAPTTTITSVTGASYASVQVEGKIDPKNAQYVQWSYEASTDGGSTWQPTNFGGLIFEGGNSQEVNGEITELKPGSTYQLRLMAFRYDDGSQGISAGPNPEFTTLPLDPPSVDIDPVTAPTATTANFSGHVVTNTPPAKPSAADVHWHFECTPQCPGLEGTVTATEGEADVEAEAKGLEPNTDYQVTLVAKNAGDPVSSSPVTFKTIAIAPDAATIPAFIPPGGTTALLGGRLNSHNSTTHYWFEYGADTNYGTSAPATKDAAAGSGGQDKVVTQEISGLAPNTTYHYRLVAKNSVGESKGEDLTFATPSAAPQQPPAGSCSNEQFRVGPSAALPDCRAYELVSPPDLGGQSVWSPSIEPARDGNAALWITTAVRPGFPRANGGEDLYISRRGADGWTDKYVGPPGNEVGGVSPLAYATPNLEHFIFRTYGATFSGDDGPKIPNAEQSQDLYREEPDGSFVHINQGSDPEDVSAEVVTMQGITPDGMELLFNDTRALEPAALPGSLYFRSGNTTEVVSKDENDVPVEAYGGILSEDGSTVAFGNSLGNHIWIRDLATGHSTLVASDLSGISQIGFSALSADGTRLILNDATQLTPDDEDSSTDLYEYNRDTESLTRLTTGSPGSGNADTCGAGDCGAHFLTMTKDGIGVYFTSAERLDGSKGVEGGSNLYLHAGGQTTYVATFAPGDNGFQLTPDESTLLFESHARITAYDSAGHNEIYAYDSDTDRIACVSCRPDGAAPSGDASFRNGPGYWFGGLRKGSVNSDADGRHYYFHTADSLVPADTNGRIDVYEYDVASATPLLISDGKSDSDTAFWGNSSDGRDIFLASGQPLTSEDGSVSAHKLYDARIGGGFPTPVKPPPCEGEGCRGHGSAVPAAAAPATPSFEGPPNPKPSKGKKHKKKHQKRKVHGKKSHGHKRAANSNGRTGR